MKKIINYINIIYIKFKQSFYFLAEYLMLIINNIVFGIIQLSILIAISNYKVIIDNKLVTYIIFVIIIKEITFSDVYKGIENDYQRGKILFILSRPINIRTYYILELFSNFVFNLLKIFPILIIYIIIIPESFNYFKFLIFFFDSFLIFLIINIILMIFSFLSFKSYFNTGIVQIYNFIYMIFSGLLFPFDIFPKWFQKIANCLPFKYLAYKPILEIIINNQIIYKTFIYYVLLPQFIILIMVYSIFIITLHFAREKMTIFG